MLILQFCVFDHSGAVWIGYYINPTEHPKGFVCDKDGKTYEIRENIADQSRMLQNNQVSSHSC